MAHRSTHPHKTALKDSEESGDLTTLASGPGKTEDQNIHSVTSWQEKKSYVDEGSYSAVLKLLLLC